METFIVSNTNSARVTLWDTTGEEEKPELLKKALEGVDVILLCFDAMILGTLEALEQVFLENSEIKKKTEKVALEKKK